MKHYFGIVIEQSLRSPDVLPQAQIIARKQVGTWRFLLTSVPESEIDEQVRALQAGMVTDDNWYAHYFLGEELIVVFRDASFRVTTDPASWRPAIDHGLRSGIPMKQLDFKPRTVQDTEAFFALKFPLQP